MNKLILLCLGIAIAVGGFVAGTKFAPQPGPDQQAEIFIPDDPVLSEWFIHNNGGIRTYATLRQKRDNGTLQFPERFIENFEDAEAVNAHDAIVLYASYPAPHHALYAFYRSLKHRSGTALNAPEFPATLLQSMLFADSAMYLSVLDDDLQTYQAAAASRECALRALTEGRRGDVALVCVPALASQVSEILDISIGSNP